MVSILSSVAITIILTCLASGLIIKEDECITPSWSIGSCVEIHRCEKLKALIKSSIEDREYLKRFHCGFEGKIPKVCCTQVSPTSNSITEDVTTTTIAPARTCRTLESKPGTCVKLDQCPALARRLNNSVELKDLQGCDQSSVDSVCCENPSTYNIAEVEVTNGKEITSQQNGPTTSKIRVNERCGVDSSSGNKIIHGEPTLIDQYPWLAIINYESDRSHFCGGTLINSLYVLTAAHCVVSRQKHDLGAESVTLGEYDISNVGQDCILVEGDGEDCTDGSKTFIIDEIIVHHEYNKIDNVPQANDIALLKLNETVPYNDFIRPICLPELDITMFNTNNLRFNVAGWGAYDKSNKRSDVKLHTEIPYVNLKYCQSLYSHRNKPLVWNKQICAGGELNKDSCKGDSGGPLMYLNGNKYELTGVVSLGPKDCGSSGKPGVYTKVYDYVPWIMKIIDTY